MAGAVVLQCGSWKSEISVVPPKTAQEGLLGSPLLREVVGDPWSKGSPLRLYKACASLCPDSILWK